MMIGQMRVMKITKIADGLLSRNAASASGSQASGGTVRSTWKIGSSPRIAQTDWPTSVPSRTPTTEASPKPIITRWTETSTRQPRPMSCGPLSKKGCRMRSPASDQTTDGRRQRRGRPGAEDLPDEQDEREHDERRQRFAAKTGADLRLISRSAADVRRRRIGCRSTLVQRRESQLAEIAFFVIGIVMSASRSDQLQPA